MPQVDHGRLRHLVAHPDHRVERVHRRLRHQDIETQRTFCRNSSSSKRHHVRAVQVDHPGVRLDVPRQQPQDRLGQRGLPAADLAEDHDRLVVVQLEVDPVHRLHRAPAWCGSAAPGFRRCNSFSSAMVLHASQSGVEDAVEREAEHGEGQAGEHQQHCRLQHPVVQALVQGAVGVAHR